MVFPEEYSVSLACKVAGNIALGNFIVFIDSILEVENLWLEYLLKLHIANNAEVITSKITDRFGKIVEAGFSVVKNNKLLGNGFGESIDNPRFNYVQKLNSASVFFTLIVRKKFNLIQFDESINNFNLALFDFGMQLNSKGVDIYYHPLSIIQLQKKPFSFHENRNTHQPDKEIISKIRPSKVEFQKDANFLRKKRVLLLGIYLSEKLNNVVDISEIISNSRDVEVKQMWTSIGSGSNNINPIYNMTVNTISKFVPKFKILNGMLSKVDIMEYDFVVFSDDDIFLPNNFLDDFIYLQEKFDFSLAQPARTRDSYIDHVFVQQQDGMLGRETQFVEIGPLFSVRKDIYHLIFPFDEKSPMGWGYENIWAQKVGDANKKMGIIDALPISHSLRKPVENYDWSEADKQRSLLLESNPHMELNNCFFVKKVFNGE
jgi:hypothetical protein